MWICNNNGTRFCHSPSRHELSKFYILRTCRLTKELSIRVGDDLSELFIQTKLNHRFGNAHIGASDALQNKMHIFNFYYLFDSL